LEFAGIPDLGLHINERLDLHQSVFPEATFTFGMVASYECDLGHEVSGDSMTLTCMADGNFEDSYVACTPKSCGKSPFVKNGMASAPSAVYGEFVGYTCSKG